VRFEHGFAIARRGTRRELKDALDRAAMTALCGILSIQPARQLILRSEVGVAAMTGRKDKRRRKEALDRCKKDAKRDILKIDANN
jgi:hypothetical protein